MFFIDTRARKPISEQVLDNARELIITGVLAAGEKLPSVRELSEKLAISPNTVQKAYRELERDGYVYSAAGLGTFVSPPEQWRNNTALLKRPADAMKRAVTELRMLGQTKEQVLQLTTKIYEEAEQRDKS
ncbi:MAG: GntR family transcriptional regulator [Oscillospiraceae bacterium]|nr:GntR family transcriptional regulator [Oscillospiraceae bacterium]